MEPSVVAILDSAYSYAYGFVNALLVQLALPAKICLAYALFEIALPRRARNSLGAYLRGARFLVAATVVNASVFTFVRPALGMENGRKPLALVDLAPLTESEDLVLRVVGWLVAAFLVSMAGNFFYYWFHRAQHTFPALWHFHKVHHSIREMSATTSYHHVTEDLFQYVLVAFPMSFLLGVEAGTVPWIVLTIAGTHSYFIHSNAAINLGPLRYVIGENRFHRLHHSLDPRHFNRNFGTTTPLWDVLFGTAYFPKPGEWPEVGLSDVPEPRTVADYVMMPFRRAF